MKARLSLELAIIMLFDGKFIDELRLLIEQKNGSIFINATKIADRCSSIKPGDTIERIRAIQDIIKTLDLSEHVQVSGK
jgi:hypothetical protein